MRLDLYLTEKGYAESRTRASRLISEGKVSVDGKICVKPSFEVEYSLPHEISVRNDEKYVSRGGMKLEAAIKAFGADFTDKRIIDIGASTGGFTDCALSYGAREVTAVDSGKGQLHKKLLDDERVTLHEGCNARYISREEYGVFDGAVMDVSFISQTLIHKNIFDLLAPDGFFISLIKPQFEVGRSGVGKNGIVKKAEDREAAVTKVVESAEACGFSTLGIIRSPIEGGDGNVEYLGYFKKNSDGVTCLLKDLKTDIKRL